MSKEELKKLLINHGIMDGIHTGHYDPVIRHDDEARKVPGGRSLIISYYDQSRYICTKHELRAKDGHLIHQDVEDAVIGNIRYERRKTERR